MVSENVAVAFYTATASDPDGDALTFSIAGGADAGDLQIQPTSGALSFVSPPNFEAPADADVDNVYRVTLAVFDGTVSVSLDLSVTVSNVAGRIAARRVAAGFTEPLFLTGRGDGSPRVLVVEKGGLVRVLNPMTGAIESAPFLNVSTQISTDGERGLLGLALAPDFRTSGFIYVHLTNPAGTIEIRRYRVAGSTADPASADVILSVPHPLSNHNGGWVAFGPDGFLYIGLGDGGGAGDPDGNGQNPSTLLGKILRIDPRTDSFPSDANRDYAIPAGNPFAAGGGAPEIWVRGLRNPFRAGFDRATGFLFIGDVGQGAIEEIDLARLQDAGANYGWNILEGTQLFPPPRPTIGLTPPIAEYPHGSAASQGNSVTGGYVYRGPIAALRGEYVFGDFISRRLFSFPASAAVQGSTLSNTQFADRTAQWAPSGSALGNISSFGEDDSANLYIVDFDGEIFMLDEIE
jgi:glucose/arabinose dehydrogenase